MSLIKKINIFERLKKYRKELEKICKIPLIKTENKLLIIHLKDKDEKIEELKTEIEKLKGVIDYERLTKQKAKDRNVKLAVKVSELEEELEEKE